MAEPSSTENKVSNLPQLTRHVTTHDPSTGKAIIHSSDPLGWTPFDASNMEFAVVYTTSTFPPDLNSDADLASHTSTISSGTLGLVNKGGSVLRCVDFAPGYKCAMHRTQSLDYGIVLEGVIDMVLDSGEVVRSMRRGDVAVQRATMHQWVNASETEWARMMFVLQDCKPLTVKGERYGEELGGEEGGLPASNNQ